MELNGSQANRVGNAPDAFGAELVYKDTHQRDERRQGLDNRLGLRRLDVSRAAFVKVEAQRVGTQVDRLLASSRLVMPQILTRTMFSISREGELALCPFISSDSESSVPSKRVQAFRTS